MALRKRNIIMADSMWAGLTKVAGRIAMNSGERTTVSDVIRLACLSLIESDQAITEEEKREVQES